jgi:hypothetical protein
MCEIGQGIFKSILEDQVFYFATAQEINMESVIIHVPWAQKGLG